MTGTDGFKCSWRFDAHAKKELEGLEAVGRETLATAMKLYAKGRAFPRQVKSLGDGILEIRVNIGSNHFRMLYFHPLPHIAVGLVCFYKNTAKTPPQAIALAKERRGTWQSCN